MIETLQPIKATMLTCGAVELNGEEWENVIALEAIDARWRLAAGTYYIVPEAMWEQISRIARAVEVKDEKSVDV